MLYLLFVDLFIIFAITLMQSIMHTVGLKSGAFLANYVIVPINSQTGRSLNNSSDDDESSDAPSIQQTGTPSWINRTLNNLMNNLSNPNEVKVFESSVEETPRTELEEDNRNNNCGDTELSEILRTWNNLFVNLNPERTSLYNQGGNQTDRKVEYPSWSHGELQRVEMAPPIRKCHNKNPGHVHDVRNRGSKILEHAYEKIVKVDEAALVSFVDTLIRDVTEKIIVANSEITANMEDIKMGNNDKNYEEKIALSLRELFNSIDNSDANNAGLSNSGPKHYEANDGSMIGTKRQQLRRQYSRTSMTKPSALSLVNKQRFETSRNLDKRDKLSAESNMRGAQCSSSHASFHGSSHASSSVIASLSRTLTSRALDASIRLVEDKLVLQASQSRASTHLKLSKTVEELTSDELSQQTEYPSGGKEQFTHTASIDLFWSSLARTTYSSSLAELLTRERAESLSDERLMDAFHTVVSSVLDSKEQAGEANREACMQAAELEDDFVDRAIYQFVSDVIQAVTKLLKTNIEEFHRTSVNNDSNHFPGMCSADNKQQSSLESPCPQTVVNVISSLFLNSSDKLNPPFVEDIQPSTLKDPDFPTSSFTEQLDNASCSTNQDLNLNLGRFHELNTTVYGNAMLQNTHLLLRQHLVCIVREELTMLKEILDQSRQAVMAAHYFNCVTGSAALSVYANLCRLAALISKPARCGTNSNAALNARTGKYLRETVIRKGHGFETDVLRDINHGLIRLKFLNETSTSSF